MKTISIFLIWIILLACSSITILNIGIFHQNGGLFFSRIDNIWPIFNFFTQWDGGNYYAISQNGYIHPYLFAYFPLYPGLISILSNVFHPIVTGLVISFISTLIFLYFYSRIIKSFYPQLTKNYVLAILSFPSAFILVCFYPESLFLAITAISSYLFFAKKEYFPAVVFASLASITRAQGIVFLMLLIFFVFRIKVQILHKIFLILISIIPLGIYLIIQKIYYGSFIAFIQAQIFWKRFSMPEFKLQLDYLGIVALINLVFFIFAVVLLILNYKKLKKFDLLFFVLAFLLPISTGSLESVPRYLLSAYPFFVLLSFFNLNPLAQKITIPLFILLQAVFFTLFVSGNWIF